MKKIIYRLSAIMLFVIIVYSNIIIVGNKVYAEGDFKHSTPKNDIKVKVKESSVENLNPSDIKVDKLQDVKIGNKTKEKLMSKMGDPITLNITFYTDLDEENGGCGGWVSNNQRIQPGMVAAGWGYGTTLYIPSFKKSIAGLWDRKEFVVQDRMASNELQKASNRVDVYVPRVDGESNSEYRDRVNSYGRYSVQAYIKYK